MRKRRYGSRSDRSKKQGQQARGGSRIAACLLRLNRQQLCGSSQLGALGRQVGHGQRWGKTIERGRAAELEGAGSQQRA